MVFLKIFYAYATLSPSGSIRSLILGDSSKAEACLPPFAIQRIGIQLYILLIFFVASIVRSQFKLKPVQMNMCIYLLSTQPIGPSIYLRIVYTDWQQFSMVLGRRVFPSPAWSCCQELNLGCSAWNNVLYHWAVALSPTTVLRFCEGWGAITIKLV